MVRVFGVRLKQQRDRIMRKILREMRDLFAKLMRYPFGRPYVKKLLTAVASITLLLAPVAPASANPTLPTGDALYEVTCDTTSLDHQLYSLSLADGLRTAIGSGTGVMTTGELNDCALQGAILPGTDWFYHNDYSVETLFRTNLVTGVVEEVGLLREGGTNHGIYSIAIDDDGNAFALSYEKLFSLDLATGNLTAIVDANTYDLASGYPYGFAYDPKTDKFYVVEGGGGGLYTLNMSTGVFSHVATNLRRVVYSMTFDSHGMLWTKGLDNFVSRVSLADFGTNESWENSDEFTPAFLGASIVVARFETSEDDEEGLANTGSTDATPYLVGGLLAAGIALVLRRRRV